MNRHRFRGALLGLATGDALGTTVEFKPRGSFPPVTGIVGGGPAGWLEKLSWRHRISDLAERLRARHI